MARALILIALVASFASLIGAQTPAQPPPLTADQKGLFALLDRFDPLDTAPLQFGRVVVTRLRGDEREWRETEEDEGFLLANGTRFRLRTIGLSTLTFDTAETTEDRGDVQERSRRRFAPADLGRFAGEFAVYLEDIEQGRASGRHMTGPDRVMSQLAFGALLARACARRGLVTQVHALWDAMPSQQKMRSALARGFHDWLTQSFADESVTRADLLRMTTVWLAAFDENLYYAEARKRAAVLERMVAEDRAAPTSREAGAAVTASELVRQLRDQRTPVGERFQLRGSFMLDKRKPDHSPAARLVTMGLPAVPALLAALDDDRLSRCVYCVERFSGALFVVTVGQIADDVLQEISGLGFRGEEDNVRWREWWASVQAKGEEATLLEFTLRGDKSTCRAATRLLQRWPQRVGDVIDFLQRGEQENRRELLSIVASVRDPRVVPFFVQELASARRLDCCLEAARALLDRDRTAAVDFLVALWERGPVTTATSRVAADSRPSLPAASSWDLPNVVDLMLDSGDPKALQAIASRLMSREPELRLHVLGTMRYLKLAKLVARVDAARRPAIEAQLEQVLVTLLEDTFRSNESQNVTYGRTWFTWNRPRTADLAALALSELWPDRWRFDPRVSARSRDRQIAGLKDLDRTRRGLPAIPVAPDSRPASQAMAAEDLANQVAAVDLDAGGVPVPDELAARIKGTERAPLTAEALIDLMLAAVAALPDGRGRVRVCADRATDGTGIVIELELEAGREKGEQRARLGCIVWRGPETLCDSGDRGARSTYDDAGDFGKQREAIAKALAAPRPVPVVVQLELSWD